MKSLGLLCLIVVIFSIGVVTGREFEVGDVFNRPTSAVSFSGDTTGSEQDVTNLDFNMFWRVWNTMSSRYVDEEKVDEKEMFYGAIKGVVSSYDDPATIYLTPDETSAFNDSNSGKYFSGIGAELGYKNNQIVVIAPIKGSPAIAAGVRAGDLILAVDGVDIEPTESIYDVVLKIRGEAGTDVTITVLHKDASATEDIKITRGDITIPSMEYELSKVNSDIAIFDISRFTESSLQGWQNEWDKMVDSLIADNAKGLIIDLRGNPGGFLNAATYAASEFLPKGTIILKEQDRDGKTVDFKVTRKGRLLEIPVVVLVNEGSASSSEILSGALQKNDRAEIVGVDTYGKGTAQDVVDLPDGSSLHITVLKWLMPDGSWLNPENPIQPDTDVEYTDEDFKAGVDSQMNKAIDILK